MVDVAETWEIDSYHVNCGLGDCSIHVLVKVTGIGSALEKVLLLDGGTAKESARQLDATIKQIEANPRYWAVGQGISNVLRFNTVVISHWDEDHYGGISAMLQRAYEEGQIDEDSERYERFVYTNPPTMVFAQDSNSFGKGGLILDRKNMKMGFRPKGHTIPITLANAQWGTSTIGTEFFSLKSLANINAARALVEQAAVQFSQIETLSDLMTLHDNPPYGMYCIAAEEYVIGQKKKVSRGWPWKLKDIPEQVMHVERTTDTNRGSLCHIVAWPSQNNQPPRVSHYLGADLNARAEAYVLNWLDKSGVTRITCMKASHHGARTSNPPLFLKKFRPKRIIISAKDMHGHPSWQFMVMILAYMMHEKHRDPDAKPPCLFTCCPYWIQPIFDEPGEDEVDEDFDMGQFVGGKEFQALKSNKKAAAIHFTTVMIRMFGPAYWLSSGMQGFLERYQGYKTASNVEAFSEMAAFLFVNQTSLWADLWAGLDVKELSPKDTHITYVSVKLTPDEARDGRAGVRSAIGGQEVDPDTLDNSKQADANINTVALVINIGVSTDPVQGVDLVLPPATDAPGLDNNGDSVMATRLGTVRDPDQPPNKPVPKMSVLDVVAETTLNSSSKKIYKPSKALGRAQRDAEQARTETEKKKKLAADKARAERLQNRRGGADGIMMQQAFHSMQFGTLIAGEIEFDALTSDVSSLEVPPPNNTGPFLLVSSELMGRQKDTEPTPDLTAEYRILRNDLALDRFTSGLLGMAIRLESAPKSPPPSPTAAGLDGGARLDSQDVLAMWLQLALKAEMAVYGTASTISGLRIEVGNMTFSTNTASTAIGRPEALLTSTGLSKWTKNGTMVFGLVGKPSDDVAGGLSTGAIISSLASFEVQNSARKSSVPFIEAAAEILDGTDGVRWNLSTSERSRNGMWITPGAAYHTVIRLEYTMTTGTEASLNAFVKRLLNTSDSLEVSEVTLVFKKTCEMEFLPNGTKGARISRSGVLSAAVKIKAQPGPVELMMSVELVSRSGLKLKVWTRNNSADFGALARGLLKNNFPDGDSSFAELSSGAGIISNDVKDGSQFFFRRLILQFDDKKLRLLSARLSIEVNAKLGRSSEPGKNMPGQNVALLLEGGYNAASSSKWSLSGGLWFPRDYPEIPYQLWSEWEAIDTFEPVTPDAARVVLLTSLIPGNTDIEPPPGIPNAVTKAEFLVTNKGLAISGTITNCRHEGDEGSDVPLLDLREVSLDLIIGWAPKSLSIALEFRLKLSLPEIAEKNDRTCSTEIRGAFAYDTGKGWQLSGGIKDLNLGELYGFFDPTVRDVLYDLLKGIIVRDLSFEYTKDGANTAFISSCQLMISDNFALNLHYDYRKGGKWEFYAVLEATHLIDEPITLGSILASLVGDPDSSLVEDLPSFLTDLTILSPESKPPKLEIRIKKEPPLGAKFVAMIEIAGLKAEFTQLSLPGDEPGKPPKTYRMFKATLSDIEMPKDVPLISQLEKPFDELGFVWLNRDMTNEALALLDPTMVTTKESLEPAGGMPNKDPVFKGGFHFMVIAKQKLVLDYPIGKKKPETEEDTSPSSGSKEVSKPDTSTAVTPTKDAPTSQAPAKPSTKAKYSKTIGPLTISNIGCKFADDTLSIIMDATFAFGPVALDLLGFTLGLHFQGGLKGIKSADSVGNFFSNIDVKVSISGLGVEFNKPPITISGAFLYEKQGSSEYYAGGLTVGFTPWLFKAAGFYGAIDMGKGEQFKCFFMYAMLRGPIISFAFAEVSGITAALGYNVDLTLPTVDKVTEFPLLAPQPAVAKSPRDTVRDLLPAAGERNPYFNPLDGARWLAAGLTITAFQMLEITALVVVQWSPHVQLAILGVAVADIPSPKSPVKFAHIELGITATVDLQGGVLKLEAQLSPNSYILHPKCRLTGGFALYYWFKSEQSNVEGDWVLSIGGYHSAFVVPKHYPRPERLAISWSIDRNLSVRGEAYFAITPKVCMGGIKIHAALSLGALSAWFDAYADFLINFAPFSFQAVAHVSVGVRFSMTVWFVTISIAVEVGASLMLAGPPFRGTVHVDFWVFGFSIDFGDHSKPEVKALSLAKFWDMVMQTESPPKGAQNKGGQKKLEGVKPPHLFVCQQGLLTDGKQDASADDAWLVRGGTLEFAVSAYFAIGELKVNGETVEKRRGQVVDPIYARPMKLTKPAKSWVEVEVMLKGDESIVDGWTVTPIVNSVPEGIWGIYDSAKDPARNGNNNITDLLKPDGGTCRLMMGLKLEAPPPEISKDTMPAYLVEKAMRQDVQFGEDEDEPVLPEMDYDRRTWLPLPEIDSVYRDEGEPDQWEAVREVWSSDGVEPEESVRLCEEAFGWSGRPLVTKKPKRFIRNFDKLCLRPMLLGFPYLHAKY